MESPTQASDAVDIINTKIFIHDPSDQALAVIRNICINNSIIRIKTVTLDVLELLANPEIFNSDICAVFLTEEPDEQGITGYHIAERAHALRNSLPIFIRTQKDTTLNEIPEAKKLGSAIAACYSLENVDKLRVSLKKYLFGIHYPMIIVETVRKVGVDVLYHTIKNSYVISSTPYLVTDYNISRTLSSIMPIEIPCGKGYLMLKVNERDLETLVQADRTSLSATTAETYEQDELMCEILNLIWGQIRTHFNGDNFEPSLEHSPQIPIVINNNRNYINLGCTKPQLCFRYLIYEKGANGVPITVDLKVIFNIRWTPEKLPDFLHKVTAQGFDSGHLEIF